MTNGTDSAFLSDLRVRVEDEIDAYAYTAGERGIGRPMSQSAVDEQLSAMRDSLVDPYWAEVEQRDTFDQVGMPPGAAPQRRCAVVAEDRNGVLLLFDPDENSFALAQRSGLRLTTFGVRGDAVGCWLAR